MDYVICSWNLRRHGRVCPVECKASGSAYRWRRFQPEQYRDRHHTLGADPAQPAICLVRGRMRSWSLSR